MIRLVATDMDGTLLNSKKELPAGFIPWVLGHPEVKVVIASGRQYYTLYDEFDGVRDRLLYIAENGGLVMERGAVLYRNIMEKEDVLLCLDALSALPFATTLLCGEKSAYMEHSTEFLEAQGHMYFHRLEFSGRLEEAVERDRIMKLALFAEGRAAELGRILREKLPARLKPVVSGTDWVDVSNRDAAKGLALRAIQKLYGIAPQECMAFGDFMNDYELLQACGESYAMANACQEIKALAKYIAPSNDEEGVLQVLLERF